MRLWLDDVRPAPEGYWRILCVNEAKFVIEMTERRYSNGERFLLEGKKIKHALPIELIDIDYDAGDFVRGGGDYIKLLDWLEETGRNYPIHIHSQNPVGVQNMRAIIERNGWTEVR